jgi:hypothetical protein
MDGSLTDELERIVRRESDESQMDVEWTKVVAMVALSLVMLQQRWRCSSQCCCCCSVVVVATMVWWRCYCCSDGVVALLLLQRWRHGAAMTVVMVLQHCSSWRCNVVALWRCSSRRCDATTLWRCNLWQRQITAHYAMMASDANDGRQRSAILQQWQVTAIEIFVFC